MQLALFSVAVTIQVQSLPSETKESDFGRMFCTNGMLWELPASQLLLWEPTHGWRKPGRPATTFLNILLDDTGATTSAELPACMKDRKDWNLRREARLRPP